MLRHRAKTSGWVILANTIILTLVFISIYKAKINNSPEVEKYESYVVSYGDTLWDIAQKYKIEGFDIRNVILEIQERNGLKSDVIRYGQVLEVPVYKQMR